MKIVFAECCPRYESYLAPYQVWGYPDEHETPATALEFGMLPGNREMTRFYLARSVRVDLNGYADTAGIRRVKNRCVDLRYRFVPRPQVEVDGRLVDMCLRYMNESRAWSSRRRGSFAPASLWARLDPPMTTHLLVVTDNRTSEPVGLAALYVEHPIMYYAMAWYDESYRSVYIGKYLKATAMNEAARAGSSHMYLGSCYSEGALYKTEFAGVQFFDGIGWSGDRRKLRLMIREQHRLNGRHLFEHPTYLADHVEPAEDDATMYLGRLPS
jgi:hypothetical protein